MRDDRIKKHQTLDDVRCRYGFTVAAVRHANRAIEGVVPHVIDRRAVVDATAAYGVPEADQLIEKHVDLVPVSRAGKPRILPRHAHSTVQHDGREETRLPCGEAKL